MTDSDRSDKGLCKACDKPTSCKIGGDYWHPSCYRKNRTVNGYSFQGRA